MPLNVPIQSIPNQKFSITLDNNIFDISIRATNRVMSVSLSINSVETISNLRAVSGGLIIPSRYEEAGNFMFITGNYDLPDYTKFNVTQSLIYFTAAELASYRLPPTVPLNDSFFNPIAAFPLRYKPQNYT